MSEAKKQAYPENITVTESQCKVPLQDLLDHTANRLIQFLKISSDNPKNLTLITKYGMDGTNIDEFKQKKTDAEGIQHNCVFSTSIVPLQLIDSDSKETIWDNPHPSSISLCRPIELLFAKEEGELCREKETDYKGQIAALQATEVAGFVISFQMHLTMIDGKVSYMGKLIKNNCAFRFICK